MHFLSSVRYRIHNFQTPDWLLIALWCFGSAAFLLWIFLCAENTMTSDHALFGLDVKHMLHNGDISLYSNSVAFLSMAYAISLIPFIALFGEGSAVVLHLPFYCSTIFALALHIILVKKAWNANIALLSLIFLLIPNAYVLKLGFFTHFSHTMPVATLALLLTVWHIQNRENRPIPILFVIGCCLGLLLWFIASSIIFLFAVTAILLLSSKTWHSAYGTLKKHPLMYYSTLLMVYGILMFFVLLRIKGQDLFSLHTHYAFEIGILLAACICLLACSPAPWKTAQRCTAFVGGFVVGLLPVIVGMVHSRAHPFYLTKFFSVSHANVWATVGNVFPALFGIQQTPYAALQGHRGLPYLLYGFVPTVLLAAALLVCLWHRRRILCSLLRLEPLSKEAYGLLVFLLPAMLYVLSLVAYSTILTNQSRYAFAALPSFSVLFALGFSDIIKRYALVGVSLIALLLLFLPHDNVKLLRGYAMSGTHIKSIMLEEFMDTHNVQGGYSDYWEAYLFTYLYNERKVFSAFHGRIHYPAYVEQVVAMPRFAVILNQTILVVQEEARDLTSFLTAYDYPKPGYRNAAVREAAENAHVLDRRRIGSFDVWLFEKNRE